MATTVGFVRAIGVVTDETFTPDVYAKLEEKFNLVAKLEDKFSLTAKQEEKFNFKGKMKK